MNKERLTRISISLLIAVLSIGGVLLMQSGTAKAGVYNAGNDTTYAEYWVVHENNFSGECDNTGHSQSFIWTFIEPSNGSGGDLACEKTLDFTMPALNGSNSVEAYIDLWRNRDTPSAAFNINSGPDHQTTVGSDWSRTPYVTSIANNEFNAGSNTITFKDTAGRYHVKDVAFRVYGPATSNTPNGYLSGILADNGFLDPTNPLSGTTMLVDSDQLVLTATVTTANVDYVEFHAYYDGYDEDNDGNFRDWHNHLTSNANPGGTDEDEMPFGGTIDHIGTVPVNGTGDYSITWNLPHIVNQSGVRFKIRLVNNDGTVNYVRDAAGGESIEFTLSRTMPVVYFVNPNFEDIILYHDGEYPEIATADIELPPDISDFDTAYLIGSYWRNPKIRVNGENPTYNAFSFDPPENSDSNGEWYLSILEIDINDLHGGSNYIEYEHRNSFGEFIEKPGPMIVLKRTTPVSGPDTTAPYAYNPNPPDGAVLVAQDAIISVNVFDAGGFDPEDLSMEVKVGAGPYQTVAPTLTGNQYNVRMVYDPPGDMVANEDYSVRITGQDLANNSMAPYIFSFKTAPDITGSNIQSDDFNACNLNDNLTQPPQWTFVNPLGDGTISLDGEKANIFVPGGVIHDLYGSTKDVPRIMQSVNDQDFDIEVKFDSELNEVIEGQGLIIEEDANNYMRFNLQYNSNNKIRVHAYIVEDDGVGGTTVTDLGSSNVSPTPGGSMYLRVVRSDFNHWIFAYSINGTSWKVPTGFEFDHFLEVSDVGLFSINWGSPATSAPEHTAVIDYFFNNASRIDPEDANGYILSLAQVGEGVVTKAAECANPVEVEATPDLGWSFDSWSGVDSIEGSTNPTPGPVAFEKNDVLVATFTRDEYTLDIDVVSVDHEGNSSASTAGGTVTVDKEFPYYYDDVVTLTAVPTDGWVFTGWSSNVSGNNTITMQQNETVTATFTQEKYYITIDPPEENGTIVIDAPVDTRNYFIYGELVTIEAIPQDADWHLVRWGGDLSGSTNPKIVTMTGDLTFSAIFSDVYEIYLPMIISP